MAIKNTLKLKGDKKVKRLIIVVAVATLLGAVASQADITLNTGITGAFLDHGGTAFPGDLWAGGGLMQLIWSTVNAYSASQISNPLGQEPGNLPGYYVLWSGTLGDISGWADDQDGGNEYYDSDVGGNNIMAGYIYARVFEVALPVENTWYASSLILNTVSGVNTNPSLPDTILDMTDGTDSWYDADLGFRLQPFDHGQVTLVPEPSTLALALAGLGLLVYRRFRK